MRSLACLACLVLASISLTSASRLHSLPLVHRATSSHRSSSQASKTASSVPPFQYGLSTVRGVNLGGWLVLEPYLTPSLFQSPGAQGAKDEWTLTHNLGRSAATKVMQQHWSSFINEDDFQLIASYGLNHVRIPVGYWAWDISEGEPYVQGQLPFLKQAVLWAANYGLRVMIDLHGVPQSQNGFDNSGHAGAMLWHKKADNIARTKAVISELAIEFQKPEYGNAVSLIELLNEPAAFKDQSIVGPYRKYLLDAYRLVRYPIDKAVASHYTVAFHDAFLSLKYWNGFMPRAKFANTMIDTHPYTVFSMPMVSWNISQRVAYICRQRNSYSTSKKLYTTVAAEWSPATTDCAPDLNGVGEGSRYEGLFPGSTRVGSCKGRTGDASLFSPEYVQELRRYWEVQTRIYGGAGDGWMMWNWKTEPRQAEDWSYMKGVQYGWIPSDATTYLFPDPCS